MSALDPRLHAFRADLADARLRGRVAAARFAEGRPARIATAQTALRRAARDKAAMDTEVLFGEAVTVFEERGGWAWCQSASDSYVGYVRADALGPPAGPATHRVQVPRAHVYPEPDIKAPPLLGLPMNARLCVDRVEGRFAVLATGGCIVVSHVSPVTLPEPDPVAVAERFLGAPYLWGGKTWDGLDCSGLVQVALEAAGVASPRDTDLQQSGLGEEIDPAEAQRGDLVFWRGHVGLLTNSATLLHANAHHMQVAREPLAQARARIAASGAEISAVRRVIG